MHLASDYIHPTPHGGRCRIRVYIPDEERDAPVVICTELANNPGASVTIAVRRVAAEVIEAHRLPTAMVWIEHHPPETTYGTSETFELVVSSSYEAMERASYLGQPLDRESVETLVGEKV